MLLLTCITIIVGSLYSPLGVFNTTNTTKDKVKKEESSPPKREIIFLANVTNEGKISDYVSLRFYATADTIIMIPDLRNDLEFIDSTYFCICDIKDKMRAENYNFPVIVVEYSPRFYDFFAFTSKFLSSPRYAIENTNPLDIPEDWIMNTSEKVELGKNKVKYLCEVPIDKILEKPKKVDSLRFHYISVRCKDDSLTQEMHLTSDYIKYKK